jgi:hypothetical protein
MIQGNAYYLYVFPLLSWLTILTLYVDCVASLLDITKVGPLFGKPKIVLCLRKWPTPFSDSMPTAVVIISVHNTAKVDFFAC